MRAQACTRFAPRPRLPLYDKGVDLKRRPPKSRPTASLGESLLRRKAARKDSAVHVSLSSDSPVKQPGTMVVPSSAGPRVVEATNFRPRSEVVQPLKVRSFGGAPSRRHADGTPYSRYIRFGPRRCQHVMVKNLTPRTCSMKTATSGPVLTFASLSGWLSCECWNQKSTGR